MLYYAEDSNVFVQVYSEIGKRINQDENLRNAPCFQNLHKFITGFVHYYHRFVTAFVPYNLVNPFTIIQPVSVTFKHNTCSNSWIRFELAFRERHRKPIFTNRSIEKKLRVSIHRTQKVTFVKSNVKRNWFYISMGQFSRRN